MQACNSSSRAVVVLVLVVLCGSVASAGTFTVGSFAFDELMARVRAAQFLSRTTFGPTILDIEDLAERMDDIGRNAAFEEWIDDQFARPVTYHRPLAETMVTDDGFTPTQNSIGVSRYRHYAWWHNAVTAQDQLRQRMAWALIQILVVGETGNNFNSNNADNQGVGRWLGLAIYYDMLLDHSFGNYRNALGDMTVHPIMGVYLSHVNNRKANPALGREPDENFGREVQQLFSIGIHELMNDGTVVTQNGIPVETYDNEDIKSFARVFTGLSYAGNSGFGGARNYSQPMVMFESQHDTDQKVLLNGTVLPAGQTGLQDINGALDNLFQHPNCPPFIARRLIQRFVKSNPSKDYIQRVANVFIDNGSGVRGDLPAVLKAILLDTEALNSLVLTIGESGGSFTSLGVHSRGTEWSRLREPVLRYTAMIRAFNPTSDFPTGRFMIPSQLNDMNQAPYQSPSVFNFYLPDFKPQGELLNYAPSPPIPNAEVVAPEFEILTPVAANRMANQYRNDVRDQELDFTIRRSAGNFAMHIALNFTSEIALAGTDPAGLLEHLDLLMCHGTMLDANRAAIVQAITEETTNTDIRAEQAILGVLTSPDYAVGE